MDGENRITAPLLFGAAMALSLTVTAGFSWLSVLLGWCAGGLISLPANRWGDQIRGILAMPASLVAIIAGLLTAEGAFPGDTFPAVSLGLVLLLYIVWNYPGAGYAGSFIGKVVLGILLLLLLCAVPDIKWETPRWPGWREAGITLLITTPWWRRMDWKWYALSGAASTAASVMTWGILGSAATVTARPFLKMVETIHMRGILQRLEGFYSVAVLLGAFCLIYYGGKLLEGESKQRRYLILVLSFLVTAGLKLWR